MIKPLQASPPSQVAVYTREIIGSSCNFNIAPRTSRESAVSRLTPAWTPPTPRPSRTTSCLISTRAPHIACCLVSNDFLSCPSDCRKVRLHAHGSWTGNLEIPGIYERLMQFYLSLGPCDSSDGSNPAPQSQSRQTNRSTQTPHLRGHPPRSVSDIRSVPILYYRTVGVLTPYIPNSHNTDYKPVRRWATSPPRRTPYRIPLSDTTDLTGRISPI